MRIAAIVLILNLMSVPCLLAAAIDYGRIPSDATGYMHLDFEPIVASALLKTTPEFAAGVTQIASYAGDHADGTGYTIKSGETDGLVVIIHAPDSPLSKFVKAGNTSTLGDFRVTYRSQEIIYSAKGFGNGLQPTAPSSASTQPVVPKPTSQPTDGNSRAARISLGFDFGPGASIDQFLYGGPCYAAFIAPDLMVVTGSLPLITGEIDVLQGRRSSLATADPQGIKMASAPGVMVLATGLTANFSRPSVDNKGAPAGGNSSNQTGENGSDMFDSLKTKARLARFDLGQDQKAMYIDAMFTMDNPDSAVQLRNLSTGVQALLSLSQPQTRLLVAPLRIDSKNNDVKILWTWPNEKLPELIQMIKQLNSKPN